MDVGVAVALGVAVGLVLALALAVSVAVGIVLTVGVDVADWVPSGVVVLVTVAEGVGAVSVAAGVTV